MIGLLPPIPHLVRQPGTLPPWAIFFLLSPWSISSGYVGVAVVFQLAGAGLSTTAIAGYMSLVLLPQTAKVAWAPLVDTTLGPKRWYLIGIVATLVMLVTVGFVPVGRQTLPVVTILVVAMSFVSTFIHLSNDVIMAYDVADDRKGQAAGWGSAANLGGSAIGGGLAIYLTQQGLPAWFPACALAVLCAACTPVLALAAPRPPAGSGENQITGLKALARDVVDLLRSRTGALAFLLLLLPIGTGGMSNLLPALARDWQAGTASVVAVSGVGGGLVQIVGSLAGGMLCDRFDRKLVYCVAGVAIALVAATMAFGPRTPVAFVTFSFLYLLVLGTCYASFTAVGLEAIGKGAAATKLMVFICVSNLSVNLVEFADGVVHDRLDVAGMLLFEAALGSVSVLLFAGVTWWTARSTSGAARQRAEGAVVGS